MAGFEALEEGERYLAQGQAARAIVELQRAAELDPGPARVHFLLGSAYAAVNSPAAAEDAFRAALARWPDYPEAHRDLGRLFASEGRTDEALAALENAVRLAPADAQARGALADFLKARAHALFEKAELAEALELARRLIALAPNDADAQFTLGNMLLRMQRPHEALTAYRHALDLVPTPKARFALASPLLMMGEFREGWDVYEARLGMQGVPWKLANPLERLWDGGKIGAGRLLVHTEQGYGDTFMFARYLPLLRGRLGPKARIELLCEPQVARLLATVDGIDALHAPAAIGSFDCDLQVPLVSLPNRLGTTLETIPRRVPYLGVPSDAKVDLPRSPSAKLAVAFVWGGRPTHAEEALRAPPIECFTSLFDLEQVHFYSLQVGAQAADIVPWLGRGNVSDLSTQLGDFAHTAAAMAQVDLVIARDTAVVHLAGALGRPVWTLLSHGCEWRWLLDREDSPWYPTMRLYRQKALGDWGEVFARVRADLERKLSDR